MSFASRASQAGMDTGWRPPTTMVDILFLLLTFFITIAAFREEEREIDVRLQAASTAAAPRSAVPIYITINDRNEVFIGPRKYEMADLRGALQSLAASSPSDPVVIRGDKAGSHGTTVEVLDIAYSLGLTNVSLATMKLEK